MNNPDDASMAEKRRIIAEEQISSYRAHAEANADMDLGGRFALVQKPATVVGASPGVSYPRLPESSPWHTDPLPPEPPLGIDINAMEPTGETFEQEASKRRRGWRRI